MSRHSRRIRRTREALRQTQPDRVEIDQRVGASVRPWISNGGIARILGYGVVQRAATGRGSLDGSVARAIEARRGGGAPLPDSVHEEMEVAFGTDLSYVRVHTDSAAHALTENMQARAFTTGHDIFFRHGTYAPSSSSGRELLGHELTHVVQQRSGTSELRPGQVSHPSDAAEQQAEAVGKTVASPSPHARSSSPVSAHSRATAGVTQLHRLASNRAIVGMVVQRLAVGDVIDMLWTATRSAIPVLGVGASLLFSEDREAALLNELVQVGFTDRNKLTNIVFWLRHPERAGTKVQKGEKELAAEWLAIRNSKVDSALARGTAEPGTTLPGSGPSSKGGSTTAALGIAEFIESHRHEYGLSSENERSAAKFYTGGKRERLRAIDPENIAKYISKYETSSNHIERSRDLFQNSSLGEWESGEDVSFIAAIATREGGATIFRTDEKLVVSGGKDTHKKGVSGLDNLWQEKYRKEFKAADLFIKAVDVDDENLREKGRNPAWIKASDLLFAHMITTANHERLFRTRHIPLSAEKAGIKTVPEDLWRDLTDTARRTWLALYYSGIGHVLKTLQELFVAQGGSGEALNLNAIMTHDKFTSMSRVILARATALRAAVFERPQESLGSAEPAQR